MKAIAIAFIAGVSVGVAGSYADVIWAWLRGGGKIDVGR